MVVLTDHLIALLLAVVLPIVGLIRYRRLERAVAAGAIPVKRRIYAQTIAMQWSVLAVTLWCWLSSDRSLEGLGVAIPLDTRFFVGIGVCALAMFFLFQAKTIRDNPELHEKIRATTSNISAIAPTTASELAWFVWVAITAGICEELLYRGYLLWYLSNGVGLTAAVFLGAIIFGIGHAYQGLSGILKTAFMGLVTGGLFVLMRSMIGVAVVHTIVDISSGFILFWINRPSPAGNESASNDAQVG